MSITIKTNLHTGVIGGGSTDARRKWNTNPRNLLAAASALIEIQKDTELAYGNVGCGRTWLEIDGQVIDPMDLTDIVHGDLWADDYTLKKTRTQYAKELLADVASGVYRERQQALLAINIEHHHT